MSPPEAFLLLTLANTTLSTPGRSESGVLHLECITVQIPEASASIDRDVYLILRLNAVETPIDPSRVIQRTDGSGWRTYSFRGTEADPTELTVTVWPPTPNSSNTLFLEDLETFEGILSQYADLRGSPDSVNVTNPVSTVGSADTTNAGLPGRNGDFRGQLVVVNEDTGEVIGQFDDRRFKVEEDPKLREKGHENDAVIIEVPESTGDADYDDAHALQMFVRAVPPDQQDWITKSATIVSHAISTTTSLLLTTITAASSYYISHSAPSPHNQTSNPNIAPSSSTDSRTPPPLPPRALVFLTSASTRKGLANVHAVSGQAVKVSSKTVSLIDGMIRRAMGARPKRQRQFLSPSPDIVSPSPISAGPLPHQSPRTLSPNPCLTPPSYSSSSQRESSFPSDKPTLPPRRSPSPIPPPIPARTMSGVPDSTIQAPQPRLSTKERVLLSADLILSTINHSTRQLLDVGTESIGAVVGHKYGPDAAQSSLLMAGTARNVGLVYVDLRGIGRKALLRRAGRTFMKARIHRS